MPSQKESQEESQGASPEESEETLDEGQARARSLALLEATHQFPCHYSITVIAFNRDSVTEAVLSVAGVRGGQDRQAVGGQDAGPTAGGGDFTVEYVARASREGKYVSHRFAVRVADAPAVLELYARLRTLEGVVTLL